LVFIFLEQTKTSTLKIVNIYFLFFFFFKCMKNKQKEIAEREIAKEKKTYLG
jgi:hypothetical protein